MRKQNENPNNTGIQSWIDSRESHPVLNEIQLRVDELSLSLANGELLNHQDNNKIAREYARIRGEICGLMYVGKIITDLKELKEREQNERYDTEL